MWLTGRLLGVSIVVSFLSLILKKCEECNELHIPFQGPLYTKCTSSYLARRPPAFENKFPLSLNPVPGIPSSFPITCFYHSGIMSIKLQSIFYFCTSPLLFYVYISDQENKRTRIRSTDTCEVSLVLGILIFQFSH